MEFAAIRGAKHSKLNILRAILQSCNGQTGTAYPGNKLIMKRANTPSKDTLWRSITFLEGQGIIRRVAFPDGGRGMAVNWGFGLPAWTTPDNLREVLENLPENRGGIESNNLPENAPKPPRKCAKTSPKTGEPTKRTIRTDNEDAPSRRDVDKLPDLNPEAVSQKFDELLRDYSYSEARRLLDEWKAERA